jgi:hypothetical protein
MGSLSSMGDLHPTHRLAAQLLRDLATDLVPLSVLERPGPFDRVESHPHCPARPHHADAVGAVVQRELAPPVHLARHPMRAHQIPDLLKVPGRFFPGGVGGPARMAQAGISLQAGPPRSHGITLALHAIHHVQSLLQLGNRSARPGLAPLLADPLRPLDHPLGLGATRRIGRDRHAQPGRPADQVGGQVAARPPGRAVVDSQPNGPAPVLERPSQAGLGRSRVDLGPTPEGGKRPSSRRPRWPRPGSEAKRLRSGRPMGYAPRHRSARSDAALGHAWMRFRTADRAGPAPTRRPESIVGSPGGWGRSSEVGPRRASRGSTRRPRSGGRLARRGRPDGPPPGGHGPGAWGRDIPGSSRSRLARGPASGDDGPYVARARTRRPGKSRIRPERLARGVFAAPGWEQVWASKTAPKKNQEDQQCSPSSSHHPSRGKTYRSD